MTDITRVNPEWPRDAADAIACAADMIAHAAKMLPAIGKLPREYHEQYQRALDSTLCASLAERLAVLADRISSDLDGAAKRDAIERCAKIAESHEPTSYSHQRPGEYRAASEIAAAIRAIGDTK